MGGVVLFGVGGWLHGWEVLLHGFSCMGSLAWTQRDVAKVEFVLR
jgi:hypothetical protein